MAACIGFEAGCLCNTCARRGYLLEEGGHAFLPGPQRRSLEARRAAMDEETRKAELARDLSRIASAEFLEDISFSV